MSKNRDTATKISHLIAAEAGKDQEVLLFGLRLFTSFVLGYLLLIVISAPFQAIWQTLTAALTVSCFRVLSGGAHASSQVRCSLIGVLVLVPAGVIAKNFNAVLNDYIPTILVIIFVLGLIIVYYYVPADTPGKPITSQVQKKYLRRLSFTLLLAWLIGVYFCYVHSTGLVEGLVVASLFGMCWQLFSLTPAGYAVVKLLDRTLKIFTWERRGIE